MADTGDDADDVRQAVEMLLNMSRKEIRHGHMTEALAAVLHAIRLTRGEDAITDVLDQAMLRSQREHQPSRMMDELAAARAMSRKLVTQETILLERGEETILKDAFEDGSSVVCCKCGALVPRLRADAHTLYWCDMAAEPLSDCD